MLSASLNKTCRSFLPRRFLLFSRQPRYRLWFSAADNGIAILWMKFAPHFFNWGEAMVCLCPPPPPPPTHQPLLTPHFYFPLELYVSITLTNNYSAFFIYQLIILWTISINWHRWLLVNNHTSKYNSFILVLYRRYINYVYVCPAPPPPTPFLAPYATDVIHIFSITQITHIVVQYIN